MTGAGDFAIRVSVASVWIVTTGPGAAQIRRCLRRDPAYGEVWELMLGNNGLRRSSRGKPASHASTLTIRERVS